MEVTGGVISDISMDGVITIHAALPNIDRALLRKYSKVQIGLPDGRTISPEQRRKAYALMREIAEWMGDLPEYVKRLMKMEFMVTRMQALEKHIFSLSDCDMTTAREFITYLIDFIIEHDVPTQTPLIELCEDISRYVYACLMHKKCAVCGANHVDLHHTQAVGSGRNRDDILQLGMPVLPLCREHHTESHNIGQKSFMEKYHLQPIGLTVEIGKKYKLTKKNLQRGD
jgi:hypothetical protein